MQTLCQLLVVLAGVMIWSMSPLLEDLVMARATAAIMGIGFMVLGICGLLGVI